MNITYLRMSWPGYQTDQGKTLIISGCVDGPEHMFAGLCKRYRVGIGWSKAETITPTLWNEDCSSLPRFKLLLEPTRTQGLQGVTVKFLEETFLIKAKNGQVFSDFLPAVLLDRVSYDDDHSKTILESIAIDVSLRMVAQALPLDPDLFVSSTIPILTHLLDARVFHVN